MKILCARVLLILIILLLPILCLADNLVPSRLGIPFGQTCTVKAKFVEKPNTYYAQNISRSDNYLMIIEINGRKLLKPLIAEPVYENGIFEKEKLYTLKAYEMICSEGEPEDWDDIPVQVNYKIKSRIVIKPL